MTKENKFLVIFALFLAVISILNLISTKIVELKGLTFSVGAYAYAITFPCTDVVSEVWGRRKANQMVWLGFFVNILAVGIVLLAIHHPPADFWAEKDKAYRSLFGLVPRILLGSMCAYLVSQFYDIWAFHFWKRVTDGKYLWLRNNLSTMTSQLIDTAIFVLISFSGELPSSILPRMILGQYVVKLVIAVVDTPIVYFAVRWTSKDKDLNIKE